MSSQLDDCKHFTVFYRINIIGRKKYVSRLKIPTGHLLLFWNFYKIRILFGTYKITKLKTQT